MRTLPPAARRRGTFLPMVAIALVGIFGFVALAIDLGVLMVEQTRLQSAADGAALAAARTLDAKSEAAGYNNNARAALEAAAQVAVANDSLARKLANADVAGVRVGVYEYNTTTQRFDIPTQWSPVYQPAGGGAPNPAPPAGKAWTAAEVELRTEHPTFFAKVVGITTMPASARALSAHRPRDIAFALDYTGSMGFESISSWPRRDRLDDEVWGYNNPDPRYPQFGHYARYTYHDHSPNTGDNDTGGTSNLSYTNVSRTNANPRLRLNPLRMTVRHAGSSEGVAPNNHSIETNGGPPVLEGTYDRNNAIIVEGFHTAAGDPATVANATLLPAFTFGPPPAGSNPDADPSLPTDPWSPSKFPRPANAAPLPDATPYADPFNYGGYNPLALRIATPAPLNYRDQSDTPVAYVGDKWPRVDGGRGPDLTAAAAQRWTALSGNTFADRYAANVIDFLYGRFPDAQKTPAAIAIGARYLNVDTGVGTLSPASSDAPKFIDWPPDAGYTPRSAFEGASASEGVDGGSNTTTGADYRDAIWERYGYDHDAKNLFEQYYIGGDPTRPTGNTSLTVRLVPPAQRFRGYSMGPGYWGKTFFIWPPDPRWGNPTPGQPPLGGKVEPDNPSPTDPVKDIHGNWICDWRRRFFLHHSGTDANPVLLDPAVHNINGLLLSSGGTPGPVLRTTSRTDPTIPPNTYKINYRAVLAWLRSGPRVVPTNLRAGRLLYYAGIPTDVTAAGSDPDQLFWREYIHFVLGVYVGTNGNMRNMANPYRTLAGVEEQDFQNGRRTQSFPAPASYDPPDPDGPFGPRPDPGPRPVPYMCYWDRPNLPRMHFWFGPATMLCFLKPNDNQVIRRWFSGTVREAQMWQLRAAISSVLQDIRNNHPNDVVGSTFFAATDSYNAPMAPTGQDWYLLRNSLFYPRAWAENLRIGTSRTNVNIDPANGLENRPYQTNAGMSQIGTRLQHASGGTDPQSGLAVAYNLLSPASHTLSGLGEGNYGVRSQGFGGRRGAGKVVILETDGVPNSDRQWGIEGSGENTRFARGSSNYPPAASPAPAGYTVPTSPSNTRRQAINIASLMVKPATTTGTSGLGNARVYAIGFGNIFEGWPNYSNMISGGRDAHDFLLAIQKVGLTSPNNSSTTRMPENQIITGPYRQRIQRLRDALEVIFQSGVQVTLIQ